MQRITAFMLAGAFAATASAQFTLVTPNGYAAAEGGTNNTFPWSRGVNSTRIQFVIDSSHFTAQGVTYPIIISQLRYRADAGTAGTWAGGSWPNVRIDMATCPVDYLAVNTTFATQLGPDLATVFTGPVTVVGGTTTAGVPGPWYITIPLTANFLYDPSLGNDLTVDIYQDGTGWTGTSRAADHVTSTGVPAPLGARIYNTSATALTSPTATATTLNFGAVTEFTYVPAAGLYPGFTATPRTGPVGQVVQFTDQSYSSAPGGILAWQWDLNGDAIIDSTLQNPSFQYNAGGYYTVSLTVVDGQFGAQTLTRTNYIGINLCDASFTTSINGLNVQFTDTSLGNPTTWAWDFQNDGNVDSTLPNPSFTYPGAGAYNCKLTVTNAYSNDTQITNLGIGIIPQPAFTSTFTGANATRGFWFQTPVRFSIVSAQVPDETAFGLQNVALYRLAGAPPVFSATATGGLQFVSTLQPSNTPIPCVVSYDAGEYVGVLGACGDATTCRNSYGVANYASSVLGQPTTLVRFGTQFNLVPTQGTSAYWQEPAGAISRVFLGVSSAVGLQYGAGSPSPYAAAPSLKTTGLPILGQNAQLTFTNNDTLAIGLVAVGVGRVNVPTPLGTLLIGTLDFTDVINGGAPLAPGSYTYTVPVPNLPALNGFGPLNWQAASIVLPTGEFALSNASEWWLGV